MVEEKLGTVDYDKNPKGMTTDEERDLLNEVRNQLADAEKRVADAKTDKEKKKRMANVYYWRKRVQVVSGKAGKPKVRVGKAEMKDPHTLVIPIFIEVPLHLKVRPIMELELGEGPVEK